MATVKLTPIRINYIINSVVTPMEKQAVSILSNLSKDTAFRTAFIASTFPTPEERELMERVPDEWLPKRTSAYFKVHVVGVEVPEVKVDAYFPPTKTKYVDVPGENHSNPIIMGVQPNSSIGQAVIDIATLRKKALDTRGELSSLLHKVKTLKQLLIAWPGALEFCPAEMVAMHNRKVDRLPKKDLEVLTVSTELKTNIIQARMLGGANG